MYCLDTYKGEHLSDKGIKGDCGVCLTPGHIVYCVMNDGIMYIGRIEDIATYRLVLVDVTKIDTNSNCTLKDMKYIRKLVLNSNEIRCMLNQYQIEDK